MGDAVERPPPRGAVRAPVEPPNDAIARPLRRRAWRCSTRLLAARRTSRAARRSPVSRGGARRRARASRRPLSPTRAGVEGADARGRLRGSRTLSRRGPAPSRSATTRLGTPLSRVPHRARCRSANDRVALSQLSLEWTRGKTRNHPPGRLIATGESNGPNGTFSPSNSAIRRGYASTRNGSIGKNVPASKPFEASVVAAIRAGVWTRQNASPLDSLKS